MLDVTEMPHPEHLFFEGAEEALDAAVPFGLADEGQRRHDAKEPKFGLEVVTHVLTAVIVAGREPGRRCGGHAPEMIADALPHRLQGFEARAVIRRLAAPHTRPCSDRWRRRS